MQVHVNTCFGYTANNKIIVKHEIAPNSAKHPSPTEFCVKISLAEYEVMQTTLALFEFF